MKIREAIYNCKTGEETIIEREETQEEMAKREQYEQRETNRVRAAEIRTELDKLSQDFIQVQCGEIIPDIEERKQKFVRLHNELRVLEGKRPRDTVYKD